jgi:hypothetical protein
VSGLPLIKLEADFDRQGYVIAPAVLSVTRTVELIALIERIRLDIADFSPKQLKRPVLEPPSSIRPRSTQFVVGSHQFPDADAKHAVARRGGKASRSSH